MWAVFDKMSLDNSIFQHFVAYVWLWLHEASDINNLFLLINEIIWEGKYFMGTLIFVNKCYSICQQEFLYIYMTIWKIILIAIKP